MCAEFMYFAAVFTHFHLHPTIKVFLQYPYSWECLDLHHFGGESHLECHPLFLLCSAFKVWRVACFLGPFFIWQCSRKCFMKSMKSLIITLIQLWFQSFEALLLGATWRMTHLTILHISSHQTFRFYDHHTICSHFRFVFSNQMFSCCSSALIGFVKLSSDCFYGNWVL